HRNARALGGKSSGDAGADPARRAGDERNFVFETHVTPGDVQVRGGRFVMRISESRSYVIPNASLSSRATGACRDATRGRGERDLHVRSYYSFGGCGGAPACNGVHAGGSLAGKLSCDASVTSSAPFTLIPSRSVVCPMHVSITTDMPAACARAAVS